MPEEPELQAPVQCVTCSDTRLLVKLEDEFLGRTVEVSHEALIRNSSKLRNWVNERHDLFRTRQGP